jgi:outer membrane protein assembly factor BamA/autotransporter translocation and assembly factor TamB
VRPKTRRLLLLALVGLAAIATVLGLGWFPQGPLRRLVERQIQSALGPGSRIGGLHVTPARLAATVDDLTLVGPSYTVRVPRIEASLAPASLLGRALVLRHVGLSSPRVELRPSTSAAPAAAPFTKPVIVEDLSVSDGSVSYRDPALGGAVQLRGLEVHGRIGGGGDLELSLGAVWERAVPVEVRSARARLRVSPLLELRLDDLEVLTERSSLSAHGPLGRLSAPHPDVDVTARVDLAEVARWSGTTPATGALALDAHVEGEAALHGRAHVTGRSLEIAGWPLDELTLDGAGDAAQATASLQASALGGRLQGQGRLDGQATSGRLELTGLDLGAVARRLAPTAAPAQGTAGGEITWNGRTDAPLTAELKLRARGTAQGLDLDAQLAASGPVQLPRVALDLGWSASLSAASASSLASLDLKGTAQGALPPAVEAEATGDVLVQTPTGPQRLALRAGVHGRGASGGVELDGHGLGGTLHATAQLDGGRLGAVGIAADGLDLAPIAQGLRGRMSAHFDGTGPVEALSGQGSVQVAGLGWQAADLGDALLSLRAERGRAELQVEAERLALHGRGQMSLASPQKHLEASLALTETPIAPLAPLLPLPPDTPLEGAASGTVELSVPMEAPGRATARVSLDRLEAHSGRLWARTRHPLALTADQARVRLETVDLEGPGVTLAASGEAGLGRDGPLQLQLRADLDLARLPLPEGWSVGGTAHAEVAIAGSPSRPRATGTVTAASASVEGARVPPVQIASARIDLVGDAAEVPPVTAAVGGGSVTLSGRFPFAAAEEARADLAWTGLDAQQLLARLQPEATPIAAALSGSLHVEGRPSLESLRGTLTVPATTLAIEEQSFALQPLQVSLDHGRVHTDGVVVETEGGSFRIAGGADLRTRALDATGRGSLDLSVLSPFLAEAALTGTAEADLTVGGRLDAPQPEGRLRLRDGTLRARALPQALTAISGDVVFEEGRLRLEDMSALFGGSTLALTGGARLGGAGVEDARVELRGRDIGVRYPEGLRSRLSIDLALTGRSGAFLLGGKVAVQSGLYDLDVALQSAGSIAEPVRSPLLRSIGLGIDVSLETPIVVKRSLDRLRVSGALSVRGDLETPTPYGRLVIEEGSLVQVQAKALRVVEGSLSYEGNWNPTLDFRAKPRDPLQSATTIYDSTLVVTGTLAAPHLEVESTPSLSLAGFLDLLGGDTKSTSEPVSGSEMQKGAVDLAKLQAGGLIASRLTGGLSRGLESIGLGQVVFADPPPEASPEPRFTLRRHLAQGAELLYSLSLVNPSHNFVQIQGEYWRGLTLTLMHLDNQSYTGRVGQVLRFGAQTPRPAAPRDQVRLADVRLEGDRLPLDVLDVRKAIGFGPGSKVTTWKVQDKADQLREHLLAKGYLDAEVGSRLEGDVAVFVVRAGPRYRTRIEGMAQPPDLEPDVRRALFADDALEAGRKHLLAVLRRAGHLRADVKTRIVDEANARVLLFGVDPGPVLRVETVDFPGAEALSSKTLLAEAGGASELLTEPAEATARIQGLYRRRHFLTATVGRPVEAEAPGGALRISVPVQEGPPAHVADVRFEGTERRVSALAALAGIVTGSVYDEDAAQRGAQRLLDRELRQGYTGARVDPEVAPSGADVIVTFHIQQGERVTIGDIEIHGLTRTPESVVRRRLDLRAGEPLDRHRLAEAEGRLMELGIFSRASVRPGEGNPAPVVVEIVESSLALRYQVGYNTTDKGTVLVDLETPGLLGTPLQVGALYSAARDVRDARVSLGLPTLLGASRLQLFRLEEDLQARDIFDPDIHITNVQVQEGALATYSLGSGPWRFPLTYTFRRTFSTVFPLPVDTASFTASAVRDTRDSPTNARRGRLWSFGLEYAPKILGSDFTFVKGVVRVSVSRDVGPAFTWAQGYRLGIAQALQGQELTSYDRFFIGGADTVRGYARDSIGPQSPILGPVGGKAFVVLNQELRYHHPSGLGLAAFYDGGNVFAELGDISFSLRHSVGMGVRYELPFSLFRVDVGFPIARRSGEKAYQWFFGIGQAF